MHSDQDIIVAQATPQNVRAPLAVLRVSGPNSWTIASQCFKSEQPLKPWRVRYGLWSDEQGLIDDVTLIAYAAPKSYTGQEMFEVICHGAPVLVDSILQSILDCGARRAKPGEFTMRAVLNGKMDLLQAEGINAVIEANTRYQAELVRHQATGPLVPFIQEQVEEILQIQAHIEATIDYGEEDIDSLEQEVLASRMLVLLDRFQQLHKTASFANSMRRGFKVLITGEPNVGKSTLFNALVKQERAIVTELPGTTRDLISEEVEIEGLPVVLIDSAGVRQTDDRIEQVGIKKIYEMLHSVDLVVFLTTDPETNPPYEKLAELPQDRWLRVQSKIDLTDQPSMDETLIRLSATTGEGLAELEKAIVVKLSAVMDGQSVYLINQRQAETIQGVIDFLQRAHHDYTEGFGEEILSSYLNSARRLLGELTGETTVEDILDRMFSNFCLGK